MNVETGSLEKPVKVSWNNLWSLVFYVCVFVIITMTSPWIISISCKELPQALSLLIFNFFQNFFLWYYGFSSCVVFPSKRLWIISISWAVDFPQFFQCITIRKALLTRENLCCWTCQQAVLESLIFSVQRYPCDNKPCVNGATCSNDDQDVSLYHCHCTDGYSGKNCQGRRFFENYQLHT